MYVNDKVIVIADTTLCKGDPAFFRNYPATLENLRLWAHERTLGSPRNVDDKKQSH